MNTLPQPLFESWSLWNAVKLAGKISVLKMVLSNQDSVPMTICGWCVSMHVTSDSHLALML